MREGFKSAIMELGKDERFVVLTGDHGYTLFDEFRAKYPDQFFNVGIAETNLVGVAAGLARAGFYPLIYGLAAFIPNRVYEFLKLQVALDSLPVMAVGDGGGLVYSTLGHSHQSLDDLALANSLPNFKVFSPASNAETFAIMTNESMLLGPTYVRLGKSDGNYNQGFGAEQLMPYKAREGEDTRIAILGHGSMVSILIELLDGDLMPSYDLWSWPCISPTEENWITRLSQYEKIVVVEEHLKHGGLYSQLSNEMSGSSRLISISASKEFHVGIGTYEWALGVNGLSRERLAREISSL